MAQVIFGQTRKPQRRKPQHPHWSACRDGECMRTPCVAYKTGYEDGRLTGREEGREEAEAAAGK